MACDVASVAIFLAAEITQVIDSIPWVRCASGNVFLSPFLLLKTYVRDVLHQNVLHSHIYKTPWCLEISHNFLFSPLAATLTRDHKILHSSSNSEDKELARPGWLTRTIYCLHKTERKGATCPAWCTCSWRSPVHRSSPATCRTWPSCRCSWGSPCMSFKFNNYFQRVTWHKFISQRLTWSGKNYTPNADLHLHLVTVEPFGEKRTWRDEKLSWKRRISHKTWNGQFLGQNDFPQIHFLTQLEMHRRLKGELAEPRFSSDTTNTNTNTKTNKKQIQIKYKHKYKYKYYK